MWHTTELIEQRRMSKSQRKESITIDLSGCGGITDVGVSAVGHGCPLLQEINLSHCRSAHAREGNGRQQLTLAIQCDSDTQPVGP